MSAQQLLAQGRVDEAMAETQRTLRDKPADAMARALYIQLLLVAGQWGKAEKQLDSLASIDPGKAVEVQIARQAVRCETARQEVFANGREPYIFGEPPQWIASLVAANKALAAGRADQAADLRASAFEAAPARPGRADTKPFQWLADADERLGPVLEAFIQGQYYWVPLDRIASIEIAPPSHLQDTIWISATLTTTNEGAVATLLPVRYPGDPGPDDAHRLARATSFETLAADSASGGVSVGHGQRVWVTDESELAILETRRIEFDAPASA